MTPEIHLFLIWETGQYKRQEIVNDIDKNFDILKIETVKWDTDYYSQNLRRFYGQNLKKGSFKERECGKGPFTLIIVRDNHPQYANRDTTAGILCINTRMFDAKTTYREWTGGGTKIHATNTPQETRKDILFLTGKKYDQFLNMPVNSTVIPDNIIDRNVIGCVQWDSLEELFDTLNETLDYVVLRNFNNLPHQYTSKEHGDIDLLVPHEEKAALLCNAIKVYSEEYRVHYRVNINHQSVRFDIRFVGDNYYDQKWEQDILQTRQWHNGFYIPREDHYRYSLLYHALIHKPTIAKDYQQMFDEFGFSKGGYLDELKSFMNQHKYEFTEPGDHTVYFNTALIDRKPSFKRNFTLKAARIDRLNQKCWSFFFRKCKGAKFRFGRLIKKLLKW